MCVLSENRICYLTLTGNELTNGTAVEGCCTDTLTESASKQYIGIFLDAGISQM